MSRIGRGGCFSAVSCTANRFCTRRRAVPFCSGRIELGLLLCEPLSVPAFLSGWLSSQVQYSRYSMNCKANFLHVLISYLRVHGDSLRSTETQKGGGDHHHH